MVAESGAIRVGNCGTNRHLVTIAASAAASFEHFELARVLCGGPQGAPEFLVVLQPALEAEPAAEQARRNPGGDHRGFDHQRARAAHRIVECRAFRRHRRPT